MESGPRTERVFNEAAARNISERERLIRQLPEKDQRQVEEIRQQAERDRLERRQLQGANRADDIKQERERLVREHPQPVLRPDGQSQRQRSASEIERLAEKTIDNRNQQEIALIALERYVAIERILADRGLSHDQFKPEQLSQQRDLVKENNGLTRDR
jgi:hypothetical protein